MVRLIHGPTGRVIVAPLEVARSARERMRGLLGRDGLSPGAGMLIERCSSIHTWFMRFPLDVMFLDGDMVIVKLARNLPPWRLAMARRARCVVELSAGALDRLGVKVGDPLRVEEGI